MNTFNVLLAWGAFLPLDEFWLNAYSMLLAVEILVSAEASEANFPTEAHDVLGGSCLKLGGIYVAAVVLYEEIVILVAATGLRE